jgi:hypothetical protein
MTILPLRNDSMAESRSLNPIFFVFLLKTKNPEIRRLQGPNKARLRRTRAAIFFHPDFTVGCASARYFGPDRISPAFARVAGFHRRSGNSRTIFCVRNHPALKINSRRTIRRNGLAASPKP